METTPSKEIAPGHVPIDGYTLEELIGRGGYGEVWRAEAPGGIKKAVKFVFGRRGEQRAEQELKSLERIKGIQHPFILGLERFEIVNEQLVIVTELAEGSLEDVFQKYRDHGSCGIPRAELLTYMRDAADALDYLHQLYQLQHLDIKPGNLLIVGGRVKVADFGLLKDLQTVECSVVGGLTPVYAPPELFDGKPSLHSDQYSLAVMYQELLCGVRPFEGRTLAQLATQHVHSAPNLDPLPASDRTHVARALEKSADRRFDSCSEFVATLCAPAYAKRATEASEHEDTAENASIADIKNLPAIDVNGSNTPQRRAGHALIVGIGGVASECMDEICTMALEQTGQEVPDFHCFFIDTDESSARSLRRFETKGRLANVCSFGVPLRSPQEYRAAGTDRFRSISRRWIYNAPRSLSTEGMRPLGRLALLDHAQTFLEALGETISSLKESCGESTPSVYLVGSLAGGCSSGMYIDVVHSLRRLLDDHGMADAKILSLLATSAMNVDPGKPLALHDTAAALTEIRHFMRPGTPYPGDAGAGLPDLPSARTPLKDIYLVAGSKIPGALNPSKTITDYIWFDATSGKQLLDAARKQNGEAQGTLRSVGLVELACEDGFAQTMLVPRLSRHLLMHWLGNPATAIHDANHCVAHILDRCKLNQDQLANSVLRKVGIGEEQTATLTEAIRQLDNEQLRDPDVVAKQVLSFVRSRVNVEYAESDVQPTVHLLQRELAKRLRERSLSIAAAIELTQLLGRSVRKNEIRLQSDADPSLLAEKTKIFVQQYAENPSMEIAVGFGQDIIQAYGSRAAATRASIICKQLTDIENRLSDAASYLAQAIQQVSKQSNTDSNSSPWKEPTNAIETQIANALPQLHEDTASTWLVNLTREPAGPVSPAALVAKVTKEAMRLLTAKNEDERDSLQSTTAIPQATQTVTYKTSVITDESDDRKMSVNDALAIAMPALLACGGQQRLMLVASSEAELRAYESEIKKVHTGELTTMVSENVSPMLIHEAQQISIDEILKRLEKLNGGNTQVTERLFSRTDIQWDRS